MFIVWWTSVLFFVPLGVVVIMFVYMDDGLVEAGTCGRDIIHDK
jgi:predicted secreted protein